MITQMVFMQVSALFGPADAPPDLFPPEAGAQVRLLPGHQGTPR